MNLLGDIRATVLILIVIGFAIFEITVGHTLDTTTSLTLLYSGLGAGGLSVAHTAGAAGVTAGVNAATAQPAPAPPPPPGQPS